MTENSVPHLRKENIIHQIEIVEGKVEEVAQDISAYVVGAPVGSGKRFALLDFIKVQRNALGNASSISIGSSSSLFFRYSDIPTRPTLGPLPQMVTPQDAQAAVEKARGAASEAGERRGREVARREQAARSLSDRIDEHKASVPGYSQAYFDLEEKIEKLDSNINDLLRIKNPNETERAVLEKSIAILTQIEKDSFLDKPKTFDKKAFREQFLLSNSEKLAIAERILEEAAKEKEKQRQEEAARQRQAREKVEAERRKAAQEAKQRKIPVKQEQSVDYAEQDIRSIAREVLSTLIAHNVNLYYAGEVALKIQDLTSLHNIIRLSYQRGDYHTVGIFSAKIGDIQSARNMMQTYMARGEYAPAGYIAQEIGDIKTVKDIMNLCVREKYYDSALDFAIYIGERSQIRKMFKKVVEETRDDVFIGNDGFVFNSSKYFDLGEKAVKIGERDIAREMMQKCIVKECYGAAGAIALELGDMAIAQQMLQVALNRNVDPYYVGCIAARIGDVNTAKRILQSYMNPPYPVYSMAGEIAVLIGDIKTVKQMIQKCLQEGEFTRDDAAKLTLKLL